MEGSGGGPSATVLLSLIGESKQTLWWKGPQENTEHIDHRVLWDVGCRVCFYQKKLVHCKHHKFFTSTPALMVLSVGKTIFLVFGMTRAGIEPTHPPSPTTDTLGITGIHPSSLQMMSCWPFQAKTCSVYWGGLQPRVKPLAWGSASPNLRARFSMGKKVACLSRLEEFQYLGTFFMSGATILKM